MVFHNAVPAAANGPVDKFPQTISAQAAHDCGAF